MLKAAIMTGDIAYSRLKDQLKSINHLGFKNRLPTMFLK
jgi:hypothetical protein